MPDRFGQILDQKGKVVSAEAKPRLDPPSGCPEIVKELPSLW